VNICISSPASSSPESPGVLRTVPLCEVGYMYALGKKLCLLKDHTFTALHTDLTGKLYREFDPYDPDGTIPSQLSRWLNDRGLSGR
jgi:hypothetical protein